MAQAAVRNALDYLSRSALFGSLSPADCLAIGNQMRPAEFSAAQMIFASGDAGAGIYLVMSGRVKLSILASDGRELSLAHAGPGDVFGEIAALDGGARTTDAVALADTRVLVLPQSALRGLIETNPRVAFAAIRFMCARLRETDQKLEAIALHSIDVRLARFLLALAETQPEAPKSGKLNLNLDISQTDIGLLIGASRPKVNAAFATLQNAGAIRKDVNGLACDVAILRQCAAFED